MSAEKLAGSGITWKKDFFEALIPAELDWDKQSDGFRYYDVQSERLTFSCG